MTYNKYDAAMDLYDDWKQAMRREFPEYDRICSAIEWLNERGFDTEDLSVSMLEMEEELAESVTGYMLHSYMRSTRRHPR